MENRRNTYVRGENAGLGVRVCAGEGDGGVGSTVAVAPNADLRTRRVELGAAFRKSELQGDDLMPDEIVPTLEVAGEVERVRLAVHYVRSELSVLRVACQLHEKGRTDVLLDPRRAVALLADLVDLEPLRVRRVELVAGRVAAGGHVRQHRPGVVRPLIQSISVSKGKAIRKAERAHVATVARGPGKRDLAAGVGVDHEGRVLRVLATREVRVRRALDGGHVVDEADRAVNCAM